MRFIIKKNIAVFLLLFSVLFSVNAQEKNNLWQKDKYSGNLASKKIERRTTPTKFDLYHLNITSLKEQLKKAPKREKSGFLKGEILNFPDEEGKMQEYRVFEASVMDDELQKKYPEIRSYIGKNVNDPSNVIRFSITNLGLHAMVLSKSKSTMYIDPYTNSKESYILYSKKDLPNTEPFQCKFEDVNTSVNNTSKSEVSSRDLDVNDGNLRTFRLAIATTGEYSQYHLSYQGISSTATESVKKAAVLSAINVTLTRVNAVYERDLSITMKLVANNTDIIFLDAATDNLTNDDGEVLIDESQSVIDSVIGFSNYDIGHTFSTGAGGLAQINSPCTASKARGVTGSSNPIGDAYDIDYVAHEMGHQFGAHHTFNGDSGSCAGGTRNDATAVEPGSGSTIMAYAGICSPENIQSQSDDYFHLVSLREIFANITNGSGTCGEISSTGNTAPVVNTLKSYTLPISTPFYLTAVASDSDGDNLTYTWEQLDTEITDIPLVSSATGGPAFRSLTPTNSPTRYFPDLNTVIAGKLQNEWEVLTSVNRNMTFGVTVRDNNTNGGQTASEVTTLTFTANAGPFAVSSQSTAETWDAGTSKTITWNVADTNLSPISCNYVNILFSTDGGYTFPIVLASNVSNDGSQDIIVPNNSTNKGRIKIESVGNIFYAMNVANISVQASEFIMNFDEITKKICAPTNAVFTFTYNTFLGFNEETTFTASGNPAGTTVTFNPTSAITNGTTVEMTVSGITDSNLGEHSIAVTGTSASTSKTTATTLNIYTSTISKPVLVSPTNNETNVLKPIVLTWNEDVNAVEYEVEIALDNTFTTVYEGSKETLNYFEPQLLQANTQYFWRVKSINVCGESNFSEVFNFTTENETCDTYTSSDTPVSIPDNSDAGGISKITITNNKKITDVNVTVNITHTWLEDLTLTLTSPSGTVIILAANLGGEEDNYTNTTFDDSATTKINLGSPPFTGTFAPQVNLSNLIDEETYGDWLLKVVDSQLEDTGEIVNWSLDICGIPVISDDDDKDGVVNTEDLCPNTPLGSVVDASGCPVFSLPEDNFTIEVVSETCTDKNNGQIHITAAETYQYTATVNGSNYNFTNSVSIENLAPGTYNLCISVSGEAYEQCFVVEIKEGTTVSAKTEVSSKMATIVVNSGTPPYSVYVNNNFIKETNESLISLNVDNGDLIEVKSGIECEGSYFKPIVLAENITAFPNPTSGIFEVALPVFSGSVKIEIFNIHSQLILSKTYELTDGKTVINLEGKPKGLYIVKAYLNKPLTLKVLKI